MIEKIKDKIEVIINDFVHDISLNDITLLSREDVYGEYLNEYFAEIDRINELAQKTMPTIFNAIKNNQISNIEAIINNLGHDVIQPDLRPIECETHTQYGDEHIISEINKLSNKAFNAILEAIK